ncbi:MAG: hypothetical protein DLM61_22260 [Pseudonocardiales bacterium]|nr:MAG: hypothetical protein DLM56_15450 [Pseudonocardiales bacterium]PZS24411.1 MAG: hypothetical protein DLM61_22260 [Pseudonocardiales bacterium]
MGRATRRHARYTTSVISRPRSCGAANCDLACSPRHGRSAWRSACGRCRCGTTSGLGVSGSGSRAGDAAQCGVTQDDRRAATAKHWGLADYSGLARRLEPAADALVNAVAPKPGDRVLDVAAGTGNVAVRAVARGAQVTACDIAPRMVQLGRERTGPEVQWFEADVENLPLPDATLDVALSAFGLIFAPRPEVALAQLRRVLVPGGRLALTAWTADGCIAERARIVKEFVPPIQPLPTH